ncbi:MAG: hypothetical protein WD768_02245 [Phycisphaeraceae bacterium]
MAGKKKTAKRKAARKATQAATATSSPDKQRPKMATGELEFFYQKGNHFRVIHADGVHGGVVPTGKHIHMAFFNERNPIPQSQVFSVSAGRLSETAIREHSKKGVVREVECDVILTLPTAKALREWLDKIIAAAQAIKDATGKDQE